MAMIQLFCECGGTGRRAASRALSSRKAPLEVQVLPFAPVCSARKRAFDRAIDAALRAGLASLFDAGVAKSVNAAALEAVSSAGSTPAIRIRCVVVKLAVAAGFRVFNLSECSSMGKSAGTPRPRLRVQVSPLTPQLFSRRA